MQGGDEIRTASDTASDAAVDAVGHTDAQSRIVKSISLDNFRGCQLGLTKKTIK